MPIAERRYTIPYSALRPISLNHLRQTHANGKSGLGRCAWAQRRASPLGRPAQGVGCSPASAGAVAGSAGSSFVRVGWAVVGERIAGKVVGVTDPDAGVVAGRVEATATGTGTGAITCESDLASQEKAAPPARTTTMTMMVMVISVSDICVILFPARPCPQPPALFIAT